VASIFTRILKGEIPAERVFEDERHLAILDIAPYQPGHVLVIPKREVPYVFDLSADEYDALWRAVRTVEAGLRKATRCKRVCVMVVGWEVPHVHVHLVPTNRTQDFPVPPKTSQTPEQLAATAEAIRRAIQPSS
jgi:histidine triad (HIT) family protein